MDAVKNGYERSGEPPGEQLLKIHAARLAFPAGARSDDEIVGTGNDRLDHLLHELGAIAPVSIQKHNDLGIGRSSVPTGSASASVAAVRLGYDPGARSARPRCGLVG